MSNVPGIVVLQEPTQLWTVVEVCGLYLSKMDRVGSYFEGMTNMGQF